LPFKHRRLLLFIPRYSFLDCYFSVWTCFSHPVGTVGWIDWRSLAVGSIWTELLSATLPHVIRTDHWPPNSATPFPNHGGFLHVGSPQLCLPSFRARLTPPALTRLAGTQNPPRQAGRIGLFLAKRRG
jgi:hypothetical protein